MDIKKKDNCINKYRIFGMNIASEFVLPQLMGSEGEPDVYILEDKVPEKLSKAYEDNNFFQVSKKELLFCVKGVGKYLISNGNRIIVDSEKGCNEQSLYLYLLGSAMGALLYQRGILPVHGSAVVVNERSIILTGDSGAGKSSLTMAFRKSGYPFLTDDIAALTQDDDGLVYVQPAYPQQKLWKDCIETMGSNTNDLAQIDTRLDKYYFSVDSGFYNSPVKLGTICEIVPDKCENVSIQVIEGIQKLYVIMRNIYRYQFTGFFETREDCFKKCSDIANKINVFRLIRPAEQFSVCSQMELLLSKIE